MSSLSVPPPWKDKCLGCDPNSSVKFVQAWSVLAYGHKGIEGGGGGGGGGTCSCPSGMTPIVYVYGFQIEYAVEKVKPKLR